MTIVKKSLHLPPRYVLTLSSKSGAITWRKSFDTVEGRSPRSGLRGVHAPECVQVAAEGHEPTLPPFDLEARDRGPFVSFRVEDFGRVEPLSAVAASNDVDEPVQRLDRVGRPGGD